MISVNNHLVYVIVVLIVVGVLLGLINRFIPMAGSVKSLINGVVIIALVIFVLQAFNIIGPILGFHF